MRKGQEIHNGSDRNAWRRGSCGSRLRVIGLSKCLIAVCGHLKPSVSRANISLIIQWPMSYFSCSLLSLPESLKKTHLFFAFSSGLYSELFWLHLLYLHTIGNFVLLFFTQSHERLREYGRSRCGWCSLGWETVMLLLDCWESALYLALCLEEFPLWPHAVKTGPDDKADDSPPHNAPSGATFDHLSVATHG